MINTVPFVFFPGCKVLDGVDKNKVADVLVPSEERCDDGGIYFLLVFFSF